MQGLYIFSKSIYNFKTGTNAIPQCIANFETGKASGVFLKYESFVSVTSRKPIVSKLQSNKRTETGEAVQEQGKVPQPGANLGINLQKVKFLEL